MDRELFLNNPFTVLYMYIVHVVFVRLGLEQAVECLKVSCDVDLSD